jgi:hypothetical protein
MPEKIMRVKWEDGADLSNSQKGLATTAPHA